MLSTLRKFDRKTRSGILANYAQGLLPSPGIDENSKQDTLSDELRKSLNDEIKRMLNLRSVDTPEAKQKVMQFLSREISAAVIETKKVKDIRDRVGQAGSLPIGLYDFLFSESFRNNCETMGLKRELVRSAFASPDAIDHLLPEQFGQDPQKAVTLITKSFHGKYPYTLLILATRDKSQLRIDHAWYVFHSDVNLALASSPTDVLKRFVDKFGFEVNVGATRAKFVLYETFQLLPSESHQLIQINAPEGAAFESILLFRPTPGTMEVAYAFAVNLNEYAKSLKDHGVKITRQL